MSFVNFKNIFHPEKKWQNKRLTASCPCDECPTYKAYEEKALYGTIAERQYAELPESCDKCLEKLLWQMDCMQKLKWYEDHDETLKNQEELCQPKT